MKEVLEYLGITNGAIIIAGLVGTIAGTQGTKKSLLASISSIFLGVGVAIYLTPLFCEIFHIVGEPSKLGIAVLVGYLGIQGIQKLIMAKFKKDGDI